MAQFFGTNGDDNLLGTDKRDQIFALQGNDNLTGGPGNDILVGGAGEDIYIWSPGDGYDTILSGGSASNEDVIQIEGEDFYDYAFAIEGKDLLIGVTADDSYDFATVGGSLRLKNFFLGEDSIDYLIADLGDNNQFYNPAGDDVPSRIYISAVTGIDQGDFTEVVIGTKQDDVITGGGGFKDWLWGQEGDDTITVGDGTLGRVRGGPGDDILYGADQADFLRGDAGNDVIDGGGDTDLVQYNKGPLGVFMNLSEAAFTFDFNGTEDVMVAAGQAIDNWGDLDTISNVENVQGSNFDDIIVGNANGNRLDARDGNDVIEGGEGNDELLGGAGVDTYLWSEGDGYDTIMAAGSAASEDIIAIDGTFYDFNWVRDGGDLLVGVVEDANYDFADVGGVSRIENFFDGGDSIDYLTADVGDNNIFYSPGGGDARLYVSAVTGTDQGNYAEAIQGTEFDDVITGGGGFKDFISGDDGNDTISVENGTIGSIGGGNGDDTLTGADQADLLRGGEGNDVIDGGDNVDLVRYNNSPDAVFVNLSDSPVTLDFNGTDDVMVAAGQAIDGFGTVDTLLNVEDVRGSNFDDIIIGSDADNTIDPLEGNNLILAGDGNDFVTLSSNFNNPGSNIVEGGAGDDLIDGGYGNDIHWGGAGDDQIEDGGGSDTFVFKNLSTEGNDYVRYFNTGDDYLDLSTFGFDDWNDAMAFASQPDADTIFSFGNGTTLTLAEVNIGGLTADNFILV